MYKKVYRTRCSDDNLEAVLEDIINHDGEIIKIFEIHFEHDDWMIIYAQESHFVESRFERRAEPRAERSSD